MLFDISLEIPPGQLAVLTGPSGSGKTTLLTLIGGLRSLQKGRIEVLGHDLAGMSAHELVLARRDIGFIFQMHNLFDSLNAVENVRMSLELGPLSPDENREAAHILDRVQRVEGCTSEDEANVARQNQLVC